VVTWSKKGTVLFAEMPSNINMGRVSRRTKWTVRYGELKASTLSRNKGTSDEPEEAPAEKPVKKPAAKKPVVKKAESTEAKPAKKAPAKPKKEAAPKDK
jgi:uncharacterized membrane-anchored protein